MRFRLALLLLPASLLVACDPVHDNAKAALGGEVDGVPHGPLHRPGQPCIVCHDGALGDPPRFTIAGTLYETPGAKVPVEGATVVVTDVNDAGARLETNSAGNFYAHATDYDPTFPVIATVVGPQGQVVKMQTLILGNGSIEPNGACASCHFDPAGPNATGHLCLALDDGGTPP